MQLPPSYSLNRIRTAVLQGIIGLVDGKLDPSELANLSRIHLDGSTIQVELPSAVKETHAWSQEDYEGFFNRSVVLYPTQHFYFGGMHITGVHSPVDSTNSSCIRFTGGADPRRFGSVLYAERHE